MFLEYVCTMYCGIVVRAATVLNNVFSNGYVFATYVHGCGVQLGLVKRAKLSEQVLSHSVGCPLLVDSTA